MPVAHRTTHAVALVSAAALALALAACGSARIVNRTADGGVLTLEGFPADAGHKAHELMTARCGGPYTVRAEGDELVAGKLEYRVHFRCGATPGQPYSQVAPPQPEPPFPDANRVFLD